jgi:hypothetical protein
MRARTLHMPELQFAALLPGDAPSRYRPAAVAGSFCQADPAALHAIAAPGTDALAGRFAKAAGTLGARRIPVRLTSV